MIRTFSRTNIGLSTVLVGDWCLRLCILFWSDQADKFVAGWDYYFADVTSQQLHFANIDCKCCEEYLSSYHASIASKQKWVNFKHSKCRIYFHFILLLIFKYEIFLSFLIHLTLQLSDGKMIRYDMIYILNYLPRVITLLRGIDSCLLITLPSKYPGPSGAMECKNKFPALNILSSKETTSIKRWVQKYYFHRKRKDTNC